MRAEGSGCGGAFRVLHKFADLLDVQEDQPGLVKTELEREAIIGVERDHRMALVLADFRAAGGVAFCVGGEVHGWIWVQVQAPCEAPLGLVTVQLCVAPFVTPFCQPLIDRSFPRQNGVPRGGAWDAFGTH